MEIKHNSNWEYLAIVLMIAAAIASAVFGPTGWAMLLILFAIFCAVMR